MVNPEHLIIAPEPMRLRHWPIRAPITECVNILTSHTLHFLKTVKEAEGGSVQVTWYSEALPVPTYSI